MRWQTLSVVAAALVCSACVSTPQTKALITPVGAVGVHSFNTPQTAPPDASAIDRMTAEIRKNETRQHN